MDFEVEVTITVTKRIEAVSAEEATFWARRFASVVTSLHVPIRSLEKACVFSISKARRVWAPNDPDRPNACNCGWEGTTGQMAAESGDPGVLQVPGVRGVLPEYTYMKGC